MTEHQTLTVRLHANDNVVTARVDILPNTAHRRRGAGRRGAHSGRPQGRHPGDRRGRADRQIRPDHRLRQRGHPARQPRPHPQCRDARLRPRLRLRRRGQADRHASPRPSAPRFDGFLRANGKVGTRNFIGVLSTVNCSATVCHHVAETLPQGRAGALRQRRRHRRADPRHRLRHGRSRRRLFRPAAHALGLCPPPQFRRRPDDRPGLRGQPDRLSAGSLSDRARARISAP